jgi:hypothetical protein
MHSHTFIISFIKLIHLGRQSFFFMKIVELLVSLCKHDNIIFT